MKMPYSQYLRIETAAGGVTTSPVSFIRACHKCLSATGRGRECRSLRHEWIRNGLTRLASERRYFQQVMLPSKTLGASFSPC